MEINRRRSLEIELELYDDANMRIKELCHFFQNEIQYKIANIKGKTLEESQDCLADLVDLAQLLNRAETEFHYKLNSFLYNFAHLFTSRNDENYKYLWDIIHDERILKYL
ncbi:hypothetical protein N5853_02405 [Bartonella sp. HY329]|uniref:hypothetical protein n=1 Tax=unclassified Bartonella TaxID=2645622 RepID=UPI0021C58C95|nr:MULTISPECIES: hypothetical protein [unclassified Bartonella]UXM95510.1 hypothetical protein N5853_02405 [Bartonella sp. HY329]UXN09835.1 hypothetical protein N5852_02415 [Bartonella sp. HY328]